LLNLGSNAAHAMRTTGGAMRINLSPVDLGEAQASALNNINPGRYLRLEFKDNGQGMDEETRKRIFDPFFTTKEVGQGTGLGLSVVHGIIEAHRGTITVDSAPGKGATFNLYLPEAQTNAAEADPVDHSFPRGNGELVAVVDDEDIVRTFAQMALEKIGYRVASFDSPANCLETMRRNPADYALLLTDQTMPVMKGIELAAEVRSFAPNVPVLIMSGYFSRISPDKLAEIGHVALLSKPFTNEELARSIYRSIHPERRSSVSPLVIQS
jgi:CheY-like chemotaxis protein